MSRGLGDVYKRQELIVLFQVNSNGMTKKLYIVSIKTRKMSLVANLGHFSVCGDGMSMM